MEFQHIDHIELCVGDAQQMAFYLCNAYDFAVLGHAETDGQRSTLLGNGGIRLLLTSGLSAGRPAAEYVHRHGDGVSVIGLRTEDARGAFTEAVRRGARPLAEPQARRRRDGSEVVTATVSGFNDVDYRFVQRTGGEAYLPGAPDVAGADAGGKLLQSVDHFAVCCPSDRLIGMVDYYQRVFGFFQVYEDDIQVGAQGMKSVVLRDPAGVLTLTIQSPDPARERGQIDDFLDAHGGAGIQHIAYAAADIATAVAELSERGARFLRTPSSYYDAIAPRLGEVGVPVDRLRAGNILVDRDHGGELFQIFSESVCVRRTLFFELIERRGASTFGTNNIKALYEAKEQELGHPAAAV